MNTTITIKCSHCGEAISLDEALTQQIQGSMKADLEKQQAKFQLELAEKEKKLAEQARKVQEAEQSVATQVAAQLAQQKSLLMAEAKQKAGQEASAELELMRNEVKEKEAKLAEARALELSMRKEKIALEEQKREFELEKQRQMDAEREKIRMDAMQLVEEQHRQRDAEKDKKLQDALRANEEMNRKLLQGSQQTQGEVQELELENLLKSTFIYDEIVPVGKGINGADVMQKVHDRSGRDCGTIIWESKITKSWSDGWIAKLKDDQRSAKAETAIIVSQALPAGIKTFGQVEGLWVTNFECAIPVAHAVRSALVQVSSAKSSLVGKNEKMEVLYNYLCGTAFKQKLEGIIDSFLNMKKDLDQEKRSMQKMWAQREKQIERITDNTSQMYGDLQGLIGASMPSIATLDLPLIELEETIVIEKKTKVKIEGVKEDQLF